MSVLDGSSLQVQTQKPFLHPEQAEISTLKIKLGNLPRWVRSHMKQRPTQSWKLALHSSVQCESSKLSFGILGMEGGNGNRKDGFETPIFRQASWSSHPVWTKSWLWNASKLALSNSLIGKMMLELDSWQIGACANQSSIFKTFTRRVPHCRPLGRRWSSGARRGGAMTLGLGGCCEFPISHTEILEIVTTFVALAFGRSKFHEPEKHQNLMRKTFFLSSTCDHFLHGTKQSHGQY